VAQRPALVHSRWARPRESQISLTITCGPGVSISTPWRSAHMILSPAQLLLPVSVQGHRQATTASPFEFFLQPSNPNSRPGRFSAPRIVIHNLKARKFGIRGAGTLNLPAEVTIPTLKMFDYVPISFIGIERCVRSAAKRGRAVRAAVFRQLFVGCRQLFASFALGRVAV
jgi:hypothetical protein